MINCDDIYPSGNYTHCTYNVSRLQIYNFFSSVSSLQYMIFLQKLDEFNLLCDMVSFELVLVIYDGFHFFRINESQYSFSRAFIFLKLKQ